VAERKAGGAWLCGGAAAHCAKSVGIRRNCAERLLANAAGLFIGVDAPDFNLALEARLKAAGIKTVHFVSPSFWAWRPRSGSRSSAQRRPCAVPVPVRARPCCGAHGIAATYVGHPLASVIPMQPDRAAARRRAGAAADAPVVAMLPGSRAPRSIPGASFFGRSAAAASAAATAIHRAGGARPAAMVEVARRVPCRPGDGLHIVRGQSHAALAACDVTLIASGTATLEAALFKRPMVIAYNMHWL
jgi:lipid-A-disaccharide synthase